MDGLDVPWPWRLAHLAVLWAFAVVQPLLDLLGGHAEFFIARGNTSGDVLVFSIGLTVLPPLVLLGIEQLVGLASRRVAGYLHAALVALLAGAFCVQVFDRIFDFGGWMILAAGLAAGVVAAALYVRREEARSLLSVLSPAPLVFLVLFLFFSDANKVVFPDEAEALGASSKSSPLVMVVFDELTTTSLEDGKGRIDETRFPNFAALADDATWYRNATTVADHTDEAIPALLTGRNPNIALDPISSDYPENLFTLFAGDRRLNVIEGSSRLCPESFCAADDGTFGERMDALVSDLSVVTAHLLLPAKLTTGLPPVNDAFAGFGGGSAEDAPRTCATSGSTTRRSARFWPASTASRSRSASCTCCCRMGRGATSPMAGTTSAATSGASSTRTTTRPGSQTRSGCPSRLSAPTCSRPATPTPCSATSSPG